MSKKDPEEFVENLVHAGVKGMKWGKRKSKKETGMSRMQGAMLDMNQRNRNANERFQAGKTTLGEKIGLAPIKLAYGKKYTERLVKTGANLAAQKERIESGKTNVSDKLEAYNSISIGDLFVSRTAYTK